jgi:hypothetical protein
VAARVSTVRLTRGDVVKYSKHVAGVVAMGKTIRPEYHDRSTWLREGDQHPTYDSFHSWWIELPGWGRTHVRLAVIMWAWMAYMLWAGTIDTVGTVLFWLTSVVYGIMLVGLLYQLTPLMRHHRVYVKPLHNVLMNIMPEEMSAQRRHRMVVIPRNFLNDDSAGVKIYLPPNEPLDTRDKQRILSAVSSKTGLPTDEVTVSWNTIGSRPHVVVKPRPRPIDSVTWQTIEERAMMHLEETRVMIGLGRGDKPICIDFENDSPHLAISAGTGAGKSVLIKIILAQMVHRGADAVILDVKRLSHTWANNLPGIKYLKDVAKVHEELLSLVEELQERNLKADRGEDVGRRMFIVVEELNSTKLQLDLYWRAHGGRGLSAAVQALIQLLCMGRQVKMHVISAAQSFTAAAIGGPAARENFGIRALSKYSSQMWNMLCGDVKPMPRKSSVKGRWQLVWGGETHEVQVAYMTDAEAQDLVRSTAAPGRVFATSVQAEVVRRPEPQKEHSSVPGNDGTWVPADTLRPGVPNFELIQGGAQGNADDEEPDTDDADTELPHASDQRMRVYRDTDDIGNSRRQLITLAEAVDQLPGQKMTLAALRLQRARDEMFPAPRSKKGAADLYDLDELVEWKIVKDVQR